MTSLFFDGTLFVIIIASCIAGFMRGFTKEFFSALGWIGALLITLYGFGYLLPIVSEHMKISWLQHILTILLLFLPSFIILRFISSLLSKAIKDSFLSGLDRTLGLGWGIIRGLVVMSILFLSLAFLHPSSLSYFENAKTFPVVRSSCLFLWNILPQDFENLEIKKYLQAPPSPSAEIRTQTLSSMTPKVLIKNKPSFR